MYAPNNTIQAVPHFSTCFPLPISLILWSPAIVNDEPYGMHGRKGWCTYCEIAGVGSALGLSPKHLIHGDGWIERDAWLWQHDKLLVGWIGQRGLYELLGGNHLAVSAPSHRHSGGNLPLVKHAAFWVRCIRDLTHSPSPPKNLTARYSYIEFQDHIWLRWILRPDVTLTIMNLYSRCVH